MTDNHALGTTIIRLMQGVVYRDTDVDTWLNLERLAGPVRDHFATIGVHVVVDAPEGFAYLLSRPETDDEEGLPRLIRRHPLAYNLSLLLVLLRKRLLEFEASGSEGRLVLNRDQILEMLRLFLASSSDEARIVDQTDRTIAKAVELSFLRAIPGESGHWEVRRILKAYVDAQTLAQFEDKLQQYAAILKSDGSAADG